MHVFPLKQCIQLEQDVRPALAGVLHVDPHLPVLLAPLVVVSVVLTPGEHSAQTKVEEYGTQQQPWSGDVTFVNDNAWTYRQHQPIELCDDTCMPVPGLRVSLTPMFFLNLMLNSAPHKMTTSKYIRPREKVKDY